MWMWITGGSFVREHWQQDACQPAHLPAGPRTRSAISATSSVAQPSLLANARASVSAGRQVGRKSWRQIKRVPRRSARR